MPATETLTGSPRCPSCPGDPGCPTSPFKMKKIVKYHIHKGLSFALKIMILNSKLSFFFYK